MIRFDPAPARTYNPEAELIPEWLSITKSHYEREKKSCYKKGHQGQRPVKGVYAAAEKNKIPITLINEKTGEVIKYKSHTEAAIAVGYKSPTGSPITVAIKRKSELLKDGSIRVRLMFKYYRVILEERE